MTKEKICIGCNKPLESDPTGANLFYAWPIEGYGLQGKMIHRKCKSKVKILVVDD